MGWPVHGPKPARWSATRNYCWHLQFIPIRFIDIASLSTNTVSLRWWLCAEQWILVFGSSKAINVEFTVLWRVICCFAPAFAQNDGQVLQDQLVHTAYATNSTMTKEHCILDIIEDEAIASSVVFIFEDHIRMRHMTGCLLLLDLLRNLPPPQKPLLRYLPPPPELTSCAISPPSWSMEQFSKLLPFRGPLRNVNGLYRPLYP